MFRLLGKLRSINLEMGAKRRRLDTDGVFSYEKIRQLMLEFAYSNLI